jgi:hypothetical protein
LFYLGITFIFISLIYLIYFIVYQYTTFFNNKNIEK